PNTRPLLEIETLGKQGLRYRNRLKFCPTPGWIESKAFELPRIKDTGGAGDWCTAGLIYTLGQKGINHFKSIRPAVLGEAISFAQALAAWSCRFEGARGGMYSIEKNNLQRDVKLIMAGKALPESKSKNSISQSTRMQNRICPACPPK